MQFHHINALIFESATHRVRKVGDYWLAERKETPDGVRSQKIGGYYRDRCGAETACETDAYAQAKGN